MRTCIALLLLVGLPLPTLAQEDTDDLAEHVRELLSPLEFDRAEVEQIELKPTQTPAHAAALAWTDIQQVPLADRIFKRYIWVPPVEGQVLLGDGPDQVQISRHKAIKRSVNLVVNEVISDLSNPVIIRPVETGDGYLLRYDLRQLAPRIVRGKPDVLRLIEVWERLAESEPWFHAGQDIGISGDAVVVVIDAQADIKIGKKVLLTASRNDQFTIIDRRDHPWIKVRIPEGKGYIHADHVRIEATKEIVFPLNPACGQPLVALSRETNSQCPIVHVGYFFNKVLTTLEGGLYYDFVFPVSRLRKLDHFKNKTDQQIFLDLFGASEERVAALRSDEKAAVFRSRVTGKPRAILVFSGSGGRPSVNQGLITLTQDMSDEDRDARQHPIRNLLKFKFAATEIIPERINGLHAYGLFNGAGRVQRAAPDNVVKDHTVPAPHTARLQPPISCYRCHNTKPDARGYQPFGNDVHTMLSNSPLNVFGEKQDQLPVDDTISRIAGLYSGRLEKPINRAADDYSDAVITATNGINTVDAFTVITDVYGKYVFKMVTPKKACHELGFVVENDESATKVLRRLLPRLPRDGLGISPEDPIIGALKAGLSVNRLEWEQVYPDAFYRSTATLQEILDNDVAQED